MKVKIRMKDPSYENDQGQKFPGDLDVEAEIDWVTHPENCEHKETMCAFCVTDWAEDNFGYIDAPEGPLSINELADGLQQQYGPGGLRAHIAQIEAETQQMREQGKFDPPDS